MRNTAATSHSPASGCRPAPINGRCSRHTDRRSASFESGFLDPIDVVARQHPAHALDKLAFANGKLRLVLLLLQERLTIRYLFLALAADLRAENEILDLHDALRLLVAALNDGARRIAAVCIFELHTVIVFRVEEIQLRAVTGIV